MTAFVFPGAIQIKTRYAKYSFTSFTSFPSRDAAYDNIFNIWQLSRPDNSKASPGGGAPGSLDDTLAGMNLVRESGIDRGISQTAASSGVVMVGESLCSMAKKATSCACGKDGRHHGQMLLDTIVPGTPEKIYCLMFESSFIQDFMKVEQKFTGEFQSVSPKLQLIICYCRRTDL